MGRADTFAVGDEGWVHHFNEEGYVILKGIFSQESIDAAKRGCNALVEAHINKLVQDGVINDTFPDASFEQRLMLACDPAHAKIPLPSEKLLPNLYRSELHTKDFYGFLCHPPLMQAVRRLMNDKVRGLRIFPNYSLRPKTPSPVHDVVWHQDAGLKGDGSPNTAPVQERMRDFGSDVMVNVWSPLVEATRENGAMKFIPRSHRRGLLPHAIASSLVAESSAKSPKLPPGSYNSSVEGHALQLLLSELEQVDVECGPGDAVLFSNVLVHRGGTNSSNGIRWSLDWRFQDASKPTHREEQGHLVWAGDGSSAKVVSDENEWATLSLT